jgi:hypothetical protein
MTNEKKNFFHPQDEYFTKFIQERNLCESTGNHYGKILKIYCNLNMKSLVDLLNEADLDE